MPGNERIVISASRRTDIPAFYMDWFMAGVGRGRFDVVNPYNQRLSQVPADPEQVHTIVFWSKNYGPFLTGRYGERLAAKGYHLYFQFTLNSASKFLEPNLPPLDRRLDQMADLCRRFGARCVNWRFDPICFFQTPAGGVENNLADFEAIAKAAARCGISRCTTSFMDHYAKIFRRPVPAAGFCFLDPTLAEKANLLVDMERTLARMGIGLRTCCEKEVLAALPAYSRIAPAACVDSARLMEIYGGSLSLKRDSGQRRAQGCRCRVSRDIGSYALHPCFHNCLFCYANPVSPPE